MVPADEVSSAAAARKEDLLVHYALALLSRSQTSDRPSPAMVRDIRVHFGSRKAAEAEATRFLRALADHELVETAVRKAAEGGLGVLDTRDRLVVDGERVSELPGVLRCYFGCAEFLSGEPAGRYVARIEPSRKRVAMWPLLDPDNVFPLSEYSVQVDLRRQDVSVRADARRLLRRSELFGLSPRSKYRRAEAAYREERSLPPSAVFERVEEGL